jgi:hypothetical protein
MEVTVETLTVTVPDEQQIADRSWNRLPDEPSLEEMVGAEVDVLRERRFFELECEKVQAKNCELRRVEDKLRTRHTQLNDVLVELRRRIEITVEQEAR